MSENDNKHIAHKEQLVAIGDDKQIVRRFQIILRSGKAISVPYSILPVFILTEDAHLIIRAYGFIATLKGRNLKALDAYLNDERVLFIKESASGTDTGDEHIFIANIEIAGKAVSESLREDEW
jgi:hypothetical protein